MGGQARELEMKIGISLCLLTCLASGLMAYRASECAICDYDREACCSWPSPGSKAFCYSKSSGCPEGSNTEHGGYAEYRETGSCEACYNSEKCCSGYPSKDLLRVCADLQGGKSCPKYTFLEPVPVDPPPYLPPPTTTSTARNYPTLPSVPVMILISKMVHSCLFLF